jgi:tRNA nucleotidyltransferase/poly(A) polymerase
MIKSLSLRSRGGKTEKHLYLPYSFKEPIHRLRQAAEVLDLDVYLVGGLIRDLLLGFPAPKDIDVVVEQKNGDLALARYLDKKYDDIHLVERAPIKYPVSILDMNGLEVQLTTPKTIEQSNNSLNIKDSSIDEDAKRRDFGVDSLFYDLREDVLVDLGGQGLEDIKNKIVRLQNNNVDVFEVDPRTLLKAVRLATTRNLQLDDSLKKQIKNHVHLLNLLKPGQIHKELDQILYSPNSKAGVQLLEDTGLSDYLKKYSKDLNIDEFLLDPNSPLHTFVAKINKSSQTQTTPYYKTKCPESGVEIYFTPSNLIENDGNVDCPEGKVKPKKVKSVSLSKRLKLKKSKPLSKRKACMDCYNYGVKNGLSARDMKEYYLNIHPKQPYKPMTEKEIRDTSRSKYDVSQQGYVTYDNASDLNTGDSSGDIKQTVELLPNM